MNSFTKNIKPPESEDLEQLIQSFTAIDASHSVYGQYGKALASHYSVQTDLEIDGKPMLGRLAIPMIDCLNRLVSIAFMSSVRSEKTIYYPENYPIGCAVFGTPEKDKPLFLVSSPEVAFALSNTGLSCLLTFTPCDWGGKNSPEPKDGGNMAHVIKSWSKAGYQQIFAPVGMDVVGIYQQWLKELDVTVLGLAVPISQFIDHATLKDELEKLVSDSLFMDSKNSDKAQNIYSFSYGGGTYRLIKQGEDAGVYYIGTDSNGEDKTPLWMCTPLRVIALTSDAKSNSWGRLLEWEDRAHVSHRWAMPMELLASDGSDIRRELLRQGVLISSNRIARDRLLDYLQMCESKQQALCVDRIGWHGGSFVLPDRSAGETDRLTVFQNPHGLEPAFAQAGTLQDWIKYIAMPAQGNSRLILALSMSFAGALLELANEESGGIHLRGGSSIGKSTALIMASSVWGQPSKYRRQWRTTTNGLEGLAAVHNDGLLVLDEISQCEPRDIGSAIYMLSNQQGKTRATKTGGSRNAASWRLLVLSSGEESLSSIMNQAGQRAKAGQENRLADITADAGAGMGLFEQLHGTDNPSDFAKTLNDAAATYYGTAGAAWVDYLSSDRTACTAQVLAHMKMFNSLHIPQSAQGQVLRVSRRFALIAAAGEMATVAGLTGWAQGVAMAAIGQCFNDWLVNFGGTGNFEERAILAHVRSFIEAHGSSRFESMTADRERINNRVGFIKVSPQGEKSYLIFPEQFKQEICRGFDYKHVEKVLLGCEWLQKNERNGGASKQRIPDQDKPIRMYVLTSKVWSEDELTESSSISGNEGNGGNTLDSKGFKKVPAVPTQVMSMGTLQTTCKINAVPEVPHVPKAKQTVINHQEIMRI